MARNYKTGLQFHGTMDYRALYYPRWNDQLSTVVLANYIITAPMDKACCEHPDTSYTETTSIQFEFNALSDINFGKIFSLGNWSCNMAHIE